jgi:GTP-binding protein
MKIRTAEFIGASSEPGRFPPATHPEIAFAGRSNVGKSSAINRLLARKHLARTSSTPGRTQQINFFGVDGRLVFVDLPGYGYARVSHAARAAWRPLVESYLRTRDALTGVVLLVDARRGLEEEERQLIEFLAVIGRPVLVVATKIDKLNRRERDAALAAFRRSLPGASGSADVALVPFSATTGEGLDEVWSAIHAFAVPPPALAAAGGRRGGRR